MRSSRSLRPADARSIALELLLPKSCRRRNLFDKQSTPKNKLKAVGQKTFRRRQLSKQFSLPRCLEHLNLCESAGGTYYLSHTNKDGTHATCAKFSRSFRSFRRFRDVFGPVRTFPDALGQVRMRSEALRSVRTFLDFFV